ncbi:MAG: flagellar hook-basal body complex protein FliE [Methanomicrobiales archaeon]|nr:flagellar hook-basal body complex protein FliE [Methanomicrobiales archaeon]
MMVAGVVGLPASGKGEFSQVAHELGIPVVVMGDVIRRAVLESGGQPTDENLGQMGNRLRADEGMDAIARRCIPRIEEQTASLVVVDGIRGEAEVRLLRNHFPDFYLIAIQAEFPTRLRRLGNRKRSDDSALEMDLLQRDARERAWGLARALEEADCALENEGDLAAFREKVRVVLSRLREEAT